MGALLCRLGRHRPQRHRSDEGTPFFTCARCGKDLYFGDGPPGSGGENLMAG